MLCLLKAQQGPSGTLSALAVVHQDTDTLYGAALVLVVVANTCGYKLGFGVTSPRS